MTTSRSKSTTRQTRPDTLCTALARFQSDVDPIYKRNQGQHSTYTDLHTLLATIRPALLANQLVLFHRLEDQKLTTVLTHMPSGESIDCCVQLLTPADSRNPLHTWGAAVTYQRRYSIQALLGLSSQDDDGAQAGHKMVRVAKPSDGFL